MPHNDQDASVTVTYRHQKPLNILQVNIRAIDAWGYNANEVIKYMLDTGCNAIVINAGGIIDFFQNPFPAAAVNKFMVSRDILNK